MRRWYFLLLLCLLPAMTAFAQSDTTDVLSQCGHDAATVRAAIEADGWSFEKLIQFSWSPNCHYLAMRLPSSHGDAGKTIAWDGVTNTRIGVIESFAPGGVNQIQWDPHGDYLLVYANNIGTYLWNLPANRQTRINNFECGLLDAYWDYDHQVLYTSAPIEWSDNWCSPYIAEGGLRVYDLNTGATLAKYNIDGYSLSYKFSDDGRYIILADDVGLVEIIDRGSWQVLTKLNINEGGGAANGDIELSPDGHYLAIGMNYLRVWDLTKPAAEIDTPVYRYPGPVARIQGVHFIDDNTIETTTWNATQRWHLTTGAQLP